MLKLEHLNHGKTFIWLFTILVVQLILIILVQLLHLTNTEHNVIFENLYVGRQCTQNILFLISVSGLISVIGPVIVIVGPAFDAVGKADKKQHKNRLTRLNNIL